MSKLLNFGPIYTQTGSILQIEYAQKCADGGSTCIGIKCNDGIVIAVEKPIISQLYVIESDKRVKQITPSISMAYTGLLQDGFNVYSRTKDYVLDHMSNLQEDPSPGMVKYFLSQDVFLFSKYMGCRPVGANFITGVYNKNSFKLLGTDSSGKTKFYKAHAVGKGAQRAKTELEKLDIDNMSVQSCVENAIRILYKSYDPLKDKEFKIEVSYISKETGYVFRSAENEDIDDLIEKYKNLSIDDDM